MRNRLQACIIDEQDNGRHISLLLKNEFPEFEIAFQTGNMENITGYFPKNIPDILFLDVKIFNENVTGLLTRFREHFSQTILITDSEKSAIQAIKTGVTDCLLKPIKSLDFVIAVNKALENVKQHKLNILNSVLQNKINLPTLQGFKRVNIDEIIRCEADSNYTFIHLSDRSKVIVSRTLYDFEKHLSEFNFFRIHHKHLINLEHLKEYIKGKGGQVIMADDSVLDVSARRKNEFLHKIA